MIQKCCAWLRPTDFAWTRGDGFLARLGIALLVMFLGCFWYLKPYEMLPEKLNGLARLVPLQWMLQPTAIHILHVLTTAGLVGYVLGWRPVWTLLPGLITLLGTGALRNSKGDIGHSTQVLAMSLLAVWLVALWAGLREREWRQLSLKWQQRTLLAVVLVLAASYVSSALVKLKSTGGTWIARVPAMPVQMIKSNLSDYYSDPQGDVSKTMTETAPQFFSAHPVVAKLVFGSGLILELGAFVLLLGRRWALLWGGALLLMHAGISWLMDIEFWNHMGLLAVTCVLPGLRRPSGP